MSKTDVRVIVLFEDDAQERFLRRLVDRLRLKPVRYEKCVDCNGVLARLTSEVQTIRQKKHQKNLGIIAVIDADDGTIRKRFDDLQRMIEAAGGPRSDDERIALVIPAWEIETWYVHLCCPEARPVDEARDDYKRHASWKRLADDLSAAAKRAAEAWMPEEGRDDPPSLLAARAELQRLA